MCLPDLDHNWPRYVLPAGVPLELSDGFLPDPESRYGQYSNPGLLTLTEFFRRRCCILLGDAGIGKSDVLRKEYERVHAIIPQPGNALFRSLRDFGSDATAEQFLASPEIAAWSADDGAELFLFLDSLDEALLRVDTWSSLLRKALAGWPLQRLWLRITCRPAFWPDSFGLALATGFGDNLWKANLAPLRQRDIESAAADHAIRADRLLTEVRRANATTFAARPLTLKMIFGIFEKHDRLPGTHAAMYEEGCRYLAGEHNADILESHRLTSISLDRRMAIVERIAALSVFCDRRLLQHPNAADAPLPEGTLTATEICSNDVTPAELREVLASALFGFQNPDVLAWTNWSYAEFLAAAWCISQKLTTASIRNLISVVGDEGTGIPQQLSSTAIWLCELRRELQSYLVELNPSLLLFIDEGAVNVGILPRLVRHSVERRTTWELSRQVSSYAHRFKYAGLAKQLRTYLHRPRKEWECATALQIAVACDLSELSDEFVGLAEDGKVSLHLRQLAASAVAHSGTKKARKAIRHLATNPVTEDARDNLKGAALSANWPSNFTLDELMPLLTRPRDANHLGTYEMFLVNFANTLDPVMPTEDVLVLMRWAQQDWLTERDVYFAPILDRIMVAAWEAIRNSEIRQAFVASFLSRLHNGLPGFPQRIGFRSRDEWPERLAQDNERRTLLLRSAILAVENSPYVLRGICSALIFGPTDSELLLEMARDGDEALRQKIDTIFFMIARERPDTLAAIALGTQEGVLDRSLTSLLTVELGSDVARQLRNDYEREEREAVARRSAIDQRLALLNQLLDRSEGGEPDAWIRIWDSVLVADWPGDHGWSGASRLDELSCWDHFDDHTRERLYSAARRFLLNGTRSPLAFPYEAGWPSRVSAEFAALLNTAERTPGDLLAVADDVWQRWSALVLWYPFIRTAERDRAFHGFLAQRMQPFLAASEQVFNLYISGSRNCSLVEGLSFHWTPEVEHFVLDKARGIDLANPCWDSLVALGLTEARQLFEEYLWEEFDRLCAMHDKSRDARLITIVALLLRHAKPGTWTKLCEVFDRSAGGSVQIAADSAGRREWNLDADRVPPGDTRRIRALGQRMDRPMASSRGDTPTVTR